MYKESNKTLLRQFKGKIDNFSSKEERNFEKKHLKAYLRGDKYFFYGIDDLGNPKRYEVQQELVEPKIITSHEKSQEN